MKRKGFTLDVSSSKALADSLDACSVSPRFSSPVVLQYEWLLMPAGSGRTRVQHAGQDHGDAMYAGRGVLLFGQRIKGRVRPLWSGQQDLHPFHRQSP